jgi:hypothetical protein
MYFEFASVVHWYTKIIVESVRDDTKALFGTAYLGSAS